MRPSLAILMAGCLIVGWSLGVITEKVWRAHDLAQQVGRLGERKP